MNQLDLLLKNSLANLSASYEDSENCPLINSIAFGCAAFFRESSWKPYSWHRDVKEHRRSSHPGLSISRSHNQVAFGSSHVEGRESDKTLLVSPRDCSVLTCKTAFLLQYSAPLNVFDIDFRKTSIADLSKRCQKELERKLAGV
jgi:hypothetical protein